MLIEESAHHDQEITSVAKRVATLLEPKLSLRLERRDGDGWLDALNDRRTRRFEKRGWRATPVEGLYDVRALLEALVWDEVARGLLTYDGRRAAGSLRQLAKKAAHQRPDSRRPEATEQARALGRQVLRAAGFPESAIDPAGVPAEAEAGSQQGEPGRPAVPPASAGDSPQAAPSTPAQDQVDAEAAAPEAASSPPVPTNADEPPREARQGLLLEPIPPATAQLAWRIDSETEELVLLEPGARPYLLGREFDCEVLLDADLGVSRRHAQVSFEEGGWWLADLGSKNGTRVGGIPISGRSQLSDGVGVSVGRTDLRFELVD